jgi:hypothetical protein
MFGTTTELRADPFREPQDFEVPTLGSVMDARPFANLYSENPRGTLDGATRVLRDFPKTMPTPDSRYPDYAAPMEDGRLVTDYRPNCSTRAPYGHQNATKAWLVENSQDVINVGRMRQAEYTGAIYGAPFRGPAPAAVQTCSVYGCSYSEGNPGGSAAGVGVERANSVAPDLPGTFDPRPFYGALQKPTQHTALNRRNEGGRNAALGYAGRQPVSDPYNMAVAYSL